MEEQNKNPYKAHILVLPYPSQGHINPILQFSKRLVSKNIKATLANTVSISKTAIINPVTPIGFETISDGFDEPGSSDSVPHDAYMARFRVVGSQTLAILIQKLDVLKKLWKVLAIGPTLPSMYLDKRLESDKDYGFNLYKPNSTACLTWLNTKPNKSVIYISYGSFAEVQAEQIEEVAHCLKENDYNFLWVVRGSEESKLPSFIRQMTEKGLVARWCPQLEVLSSTSIGCFVTHCGLNSVLEAMCLGVSIVGVPLWSDQTTNAKYVEDVWGIGVRARTDKRGIVRREMLGESIRKVMRGERKDEIEKNLVKWKGLARDAVDEGGSSDKNIDEFVSAFARS